MTIAAEQDKVLQITHNLTNIAGLALCNMQCMTSKYPLTSMNPLFM